ncbi:hypothetical protein E2C01_076223 [Portunus trituberculatus]|uniref:Uncharacterized protein n=1 Tax=Portunus trituberculatus TaxID=210409 RepID=A0A5B7ILG2_PORTR|nr:hypothetical protein [Portunus trituberculatus]
MLKFTGIIHKCRMPGQLYCAAPRVLAGASGSRDTPDFAAMARWLIPSPPRAPTPVHSDSP